MITQENTQYWKACYQCDSKNLVPFYKNKQIYKCSDCNFIFYKNIPSLTELNEVYSNYSREEYITDISRQKITSEFKNFIYIHNIKNVLDIACGECYFLDILREINPGLNLYATEHETAKQRILNKGYEFIEGDFFPKTDIKFDLIIFTEAIEHINDVTEFLEHAYELLNPKGFIYITTPNFSSLERRIMGEKWGMIVPPEHLSYFTVSTLNEALTKVKFKKIFNRSENISIYRIVEFFNNHLRSKNQTSKTKHSPQAISDRMQKASSKIFALGLIKNLINYILRVLNLGSGLKALYQKD
ncbi:class I SAM-dependent methyltransferase [Gammaproteobacteria bacterium]|nr:class I SAM-dependent methyltransferase [Gammaproteobacteria bacterium]